MSNQNRVARVPIRPAIASSTKSISCFHEKAAHSCIEQVSPCSERKDRSVRHVCGCVSVRPGRMGHPRIWVGDQEGQNNLKSITIGGTGIYYFSCELRQDGDRACFPQVCGWVTR